MNGQQATGNIAAALLSAAAAVLECRQPQRQCYFHHEGRRYLARFDWPGVVSVFDVPESKIVARSEPGHPTRPAPTVLGRQTNGH